MLRKSGAHQISGVYQSVRYTEKCAPGRRKGCPDYSLEFKQQFFAASCEYGIPGRILSPYTGGR
ncbi:hypothetical protein EJE23_11375 [Enterobacter chengduensis]|nr:hypothetical protein EJE23_11375 [Enterobacter chengduensis]